MKYCELNKKSITYLDTWEENYTKVDGPNVSLPVWNGPSSNSLSTAGDTKPVFISAWTVLYQRLMLYKISSIPIIATWKDMYIFRVAYHSKEKGTNSAQKRANKKIEVATVIVLLCPTVQFRERSSAVLYRYYNYTIQAWTIHFTFRGRSMRNIAPTL